MGTITVRILPSAVRGRGGPRSPLCRVLGRATTAFAAFWVAASHAFAQVPNVDVNPLVAKVAAAIANDPALEGSWLNVDGEDNGAGGQRAVFTRILDEDRAEAQAAAMDLLISRLVPENGWRIDRSRDVRLPYSSMVATLRDLMTWDPRFIDCAFLGGGFVENPIDGTLGWAPRFQVVKEVTPSGESRPGLRNPDRQFDALTAEARKLMGNQPEWEKAGVSLVDNLGDSQMVVATQPAGPDENQLAKQIAAAIPATPALEGTWLDVRLDDQGAPEVAPTLYVFRRVMDMTRADTQAVALEDVIRHLVPSGRSRIDLSSDMQLPYRQLGAAMQRLVERDPRFEGCRYLGAGYVDENADGSLALAPRFQVVREVADADEHRVGLRNPDKQFDALVAEFRLLVNDEAAWRDAGIGVIDNLGDLQMTVVNEPAPPDENDVVRAIAEAIQGIPSLRGAWIDVATDDQGAPEIAPVIYVFTRGFDAQRAGAQAAAIEAFVRNLLPAGRWRIDSGRDVMLPLSQLLSRVNDVTDLDPLYAGCLVSSAYYARKDADGDWRLVPVGRIWKGAQEQLIQRLVAVEMQADPAWARHGVRVLGDLKGDLAVVASNPIAAAQYFSAASHAFWGRNYRAADEALALATLDWPDNLIYRYWRVLCQLAEGDQSGAEVRLEKTVNGFNVQRYSQGHVEVLRSIYRIQGPLRYALIEAETKAMVGRTSGGTRRPSWTMN
jgi:hypothetical protein